MVIIYGHFLSITMIVVTCIFTSYRFNHSEEFVVIDTAYLEKRKVFIIREAVK